jgi:hypothetical protein
MRGLHLGRCARRILLLAPGPTDEPQVLLPERPGRAASESQRRATRRLAAVGLIELSWKVEEVQTKREKQTRPLSWNPQAGVYQEENCRQIPVRRAVEKRAVKLTPLGALVVDRLRLTLETGERIRWDALIDSETVLSG